MQKGAFTCLNGYEDANGIPSFGDYCHIMFGILVIKLATYKNLENMRVFVKVGSVRDILITRSS